MEHPAIIYGFATWWNATLAAEVTLSTAPDAPRTHWEQLYFPLDRPLEVPVGDKVSLSLRSRSTRKAGTHLAWTAARTSPDGKLIERRAHDLDKGYLP
jgi:protein arginine N-methyltransferase 1